MIGILSRILLSVVWTYGPQMGLRPEQVIGRRSGPLAPQSGVCRDRSDRRLGGEAPDLECRV